MALENALLEVLLCVCVCVCVYVCVCVRVSVFLLRDVSFADESVSERRLRLSEHEEFVLEVTPKGYFSLGGGVGRHLAV
jgi:hypothetical protein